MTPTPPPIRGLYVREVWLDERGIITRATRWTDSNGRPLPHPEPPRAPSRQLERFGPENLPREPGPFQRYRK